MPRLVNYARLSRSESPEGGSPRSPLRGKSYSTGSEDDEYLTGNLYR